MVQLSAKANSSVYICGVAFGFDGIMFPSILQNWQRFYNTNFTDADFQRVYSSFSGMQFSEESAEGPGGTYYKQKISIRFPSSDQYRSERIALLQKVKLVQIKLTNGLVIVVGRNDFEQNAKPRFSMKSNENTAEVEITASSIFPSGFTPYDGDLFGNDVPVDLFPNQSDMELLLLVRQLGTANPEIRIVNNPTGKTFTSGRFGAGYFEIIPNTNFTLTNNTYPTLENDRLPIHYIGTADNLESDGRYAYWVEAGRIGLKTTVNGVDAADNVLTTWHLIRCLI